MSRPTRIEVEYMTYTMENCLISEYFIFHIDRIKAPHWKSVQQQETQKISRNHKPPKILIEKNAMHDAGHYML